ncbi:MAG: hypothetical protein KC503_04405 [Myxococcales bacterium]|nr:hypothetical protein [Myxococcales bacterium]
MLAAACGGLEPTDPGGPIIERGASSGKADGTDDSGPEVPTSYVREARSAFADDLLCDVVANGTTIAAGATVVLGTATATCAAAGGVAVVVTGGAAAVVAAPACVFLGVGTAASAVTTITLGAIDQLVCQGGLRYLIQSIEERVTELYKGVIEVVIDGVSYILTGCSRYHYLMLHAQKKLYCSLPRKCYGPRPSCLETSAKISANHFCLAARRGIQRCWGNQADAGHRQAISEALTALTKCQALYPTCSLP